MWVLNQTEDRVINLDDMRSIEIQKPESRTLFELVALDKQCNAFVLGEYKSKNEAKLVLNSLIHQIAIQEAKT